MAIFIDPVAIVIEGDVYEYRCNVSDGASSAATMLWSLDGLPLADCQNMPVVMSCAVRVTRMMHKKTLRCEEVRLDGKTGGFDELRFYVMCKFLIARPVANKGHFSFILQYVIVL